MQMRASTIGLGTEGININCLNVSHPLCIITLKTISALSSALPYDLAGPIEKGQLGVTMAIKRDGCMIELNKQFIAEKPSITRVNMPKPGSATLIQTMLKM